MDRSLSAMDIGAGTEFLSAVTLGFTRCGTLIITYTTAENELALMV